MVSRRSTEPERAGAKSTLDVDAGARPSPPVAGDDADQASLAAVHDLIVEQAETLDGLAPRLAALAEHESTLRALVEDAREQLAEHDVALKKLRADLQQVEQERDQLRRLVREAMNEIESRDITIEALRKKSKKRKT